MAAGGTIIVDIKRDTLKKIGDYVVQRYTTSIKGRILSRHYIIKREDKKS